MADNVMFTPNPSSVEAGMAKAKSENASAAAMWRENANGQLAPSIVATETQAAADLREMNNAKAAAATASLPAGFSTPTKAI
jgi:hypothetical protein